MADKPLTELLPVLPIEDLPYAMEVTRDSKFPMSQNGAAMKVLGDQIADFAREAAAQDVQRAVDAADSAERSKERAEKAMDRAKSDANKAAQSAEKAEYYSGKPPIIQNGTWWTWNADTQEYVDTGEAAQGNLMYASFWLDPFTGDLYMYTDDEYTGPQFRLNDNNLEVLINA